MPETRTAEFVDGPAPAPVPVADGVPRNDANFGNGVNFPGCCGIPPGGRERRFPRVTE